jgi:uncharacterized protein GlcG (DUF336 family)
VKRKLIATTVILACGLVGTSAWAQGGPACQGLPNNSQLRSALIQALQQEVSPPAPANPTTGLNLNMWATIVGRDGTVCAVAFSGNTAGSQWLGSRVISAQKANTANLFSLDSSSASALTGKGAKNGLALSTANLYSAVQPGGSLFGLQESNPVDTDAAYGGNSGNYGDKDDPMVGKKIGGINVFGGGLGLYAGSGSPRFPPQLVGGVGVSGDTSCEDHMVAWRVRNNLHLDHLSGVGGVSGDTSRPDNIIYDIKPNPEGGTGISAGGFGHPTCINTGDQTKLPAVQ